MRDQKDNELEVRRLENLWAGEFGNSYTQRNREAGAGREIFWNHLFNDYVIKRGVLEIGCNVGVNLQWICQHISPQMVYGVDINAEAIQLLRQKLPDVNAIWSTAAELPFRSNWFDLVFTAGVLIHQPEASLQRVMAEIFRCSRRYVLCIEYFAEETIEVPYRDQKRALFKRNYGQLFEDAYPEMILIERGYLGKDQGWDDVTYWLFEKMQTQVEETL